jgi:SET domain-containing protein
MIIVADTKFKGRGVFAQQKILKGELIQTAPVVVIPPEQVKLIDQTILGDYYYDWENESIAIAFGLVSLFNHSYNPNAYYIKKFAEREVAYIAWRDIEAGEEITANYNNGSPDNHAPIWFESVEEVASISI